MEENTIKLPISLVTIVRNAGDNFKGWIDKHRPFVEEIIVIDQGSTDGTFDVASDYADLTIKRKCKGYPEPDKEWAVALASFPYVLVLDDDETITKEAFELIAKAMQSPIDVFWLKRKNLVDGVDIFNILGDDLQCRLWRKGAVRCSAQMHTYPEAAVGVKVAFLDAEILHERTLAGCKKSNQGRNLADPRVVQMQNEFLTKLQVFMDSQRGTNV